jgi:hypothetical protein
MNRINSYVNEVLSYIVADNKMKERIREDLISQLNEAARTQDIDSVISEMGDPKDVAREFMDSIYDDKSELFDDLLSDRPDNAIYVKRVYEYRSKASVFGVPLVHIKISRYGRPTLAKGIIAIGTISLGVVSIGAIPIGLLCIGGLAVGVIAFGGLALGLLLALGGMAVGVVASGGFAVGLGAIGGFALGKIAIGGYASGTVAIGDTAVGDYVLKVSHSGPGAAEEAAALIRTAFPGLPDWIVDLFSGAIKYLQGK